MSLQLVVTAGPDAGRTLTLQSGTDLMLGRGEKSFYRLTDPRVSRAHCQVAVEGENAVVTCNGGAGGTKVNGKVVQKHTLKLGDVLQIGDSQLRLQMGDFPLDIALAVVEGGAPKPAPANLDKLEELKGKKLAHYEVGHVLGRGKSCMVFFANDPENDNRPVALKVLMPEFSKNEEEMQRFIRAIKTTLPLKHPNLITTYAAGKTGPYCWIAMEYVAGESLKEVIKRIGIANMLDWRHAFKVAVEIGRALEYAHGQNIVHRNVTPTNILLESTTKVHKLGDLVLAKALEGSLAEQITRTGEIVGDIGYMSPERTRGLTELDHRSDLYGLGATLYALLTGRPPFEGTSLVEQITKIRQHEPVKPTKYQLSIPAQFQDVVLMLLAKKPEARYQSATALLKELERVAKFTGVKM
jgi:eukaryotic-like serine/threonine-protein kinase